MNRIQNIAGVGYPGIQNIGQLNQSQPILLPGANNIQNLQEFQKLQNLTKLQNMQAIQNALSMPNVYLNQVQGLGGMQNNHRLMTPQNLRVNDIKTGYQQPFIMPGQDLVNLQGNNINNILYQNNIQKAPGIYQNATIPISNQNINTLNANTLNINTINTLNNANGSKDKTNKIPKQDKIQKQQIVNQTNVQNIQGGYKNLTANISGNTGNVSGNLGSPGNLSNQSNKGQPNYNIKEHQYKQNQTLIKSADKAGIQVGINNKVQTTQHADQVYIHQGGGQIQTQIGQTGQTQIGQIQNQQGKVYMSPEGQQFIVNNVGNIPVIYRTPEGKQVLYNPYSSPNTSNVHEFVPEQQGVAYTDSNSSKKGLIPDQLGQIASVGQLKNNSIMESGVVIYDEPEPSENIKSNSVQNVIQNTQGNMQNIQGKQTYQNIQNVQIQQNNQGKTNKVQIQSLNSNRYNTNTNCNPTTNLNINNINPLPNATYSNNTYPISSSTSNNINTNINIDALKNNINNNINDLRPIQNRSNETPYQVLKEPLSKIFEDPDEVNYTMHDSQIPPIKNEEEDEEESENKNNINNTNILSPDSYDHASETSGIIRQDLDNTGSYGHSMNTSPLPNKEILVTLNDKITSSTQKNLDFCGEAGVNKNVKNLTNNIYNNTNLNSNMIDIVDVKLTDIVAEKPDSAAILENPGIVESNSTNQINNNQIAETIPKFKKAESAGSIRISKSLGKMSNTIKLFSEINNPKKEKAKHVLKLLYDYGAYRDEADFNINGWKDYYSPNDEFFLFNYGNDILKDQIIIKNENNLLICEVYFGDANSKGQKHGMGTMVCKHKTLRGTFRNDVFNGWGRECKKDGELIEGRFEDGYPQGKCYYKNKKGNIYKGEIFNGKKNGYGEFITNKFKYVGQFKNNKIDGKGKIEFIEEGHEYTGEFKENEINGKGIFKWKNGEVYDGEMINGKMNGKGKYSYSNGDVYEGDYVQGFKEGNGKMIYNNGKVYEGGFKHGVPDGKGVLKGNGKKIKVVFSNGKLIEKE